MTKKTRLHPNEKKLADQDYWDKLSDEEKEWLNQFNKEYYQGIYNENERKIHPEKYDRDLKDARNARIKDVFGNHKADVVPADMEDFLDDEENFIHGKDNEINMLEKIDEREALDIIREQAKDMITSRLDTLENILTDLQRDSIKIFLNARKNK